MTIHEARCTYQGKTYFGEFELIGLGPNETVSVRFKGDELDARVGGFPVEAVATAILGELVVRSTIANTVKLGENVD